MYTKMETLTPNQIERVKDRLLRLARRGQALERAWDRATAKGDATALKRLNGQADRYYRSIEKYEAMGLRVIAKAGTSRSSVLEVVVEL